MAYSTLADILEQIGEATLIDLTDDTMSGKINVAVVARAVEGADALINGFCQGRYNLPFLPVPKLARSFSVDLALFNLYSRRPHLEVPSVIQHRHSEALAYLRRVQTGEAPMGPDAEPVHAGGGQSGLMPGNPRLFNRNTLQGM